MFVFATASDSSGTGTPHPRIRPSCYHSPATFSDTNSSLGSWEEGLVYSKVSHNIDETRKYLDTEM